MHLYQGRPGADGAEGPEGPAGADGAAGPAGPAGDAPAPPAGLLAFSLLVDFGSPIENDVCLARIAENQWLVAVSTGIAKTNDAGVTWTTKASETTPVLTAFSVAYLGFGRCLAFFHNAPGYRRISTDYGETWSARQLTSNASGAVRIHQLGGGRIVHSGFGNGYLSAIYSSDYGSTWADCSPVSSDAGGNSGSNGGCSLGGGILVVPWATDTNKSIRRSTDGGITWTQLPNGTPYRTTDLVDCGHGVLFCCTAQTNQNNCSRSTDYGETFTALTVLYGKKVNCGVYLGGRLILGCDSGEILESVDKGITFASRGVCSLGAFLRMFAFDGDLLAVHPFGVVSKCAGIRS